MARPLQCTITLESNTDFVYSEPARAKAIQGKVDGDRLRRLTRQWLTGRIARPDENGCSEPEVQILGRHLYEMLFHDREIRTEFEGLVKAVRGDPDTALCLQLVFKREANELARLPWEFLYLDLGEGQEWFLACEIQFVLTRVMPSHPELPRHVLSRPLKVLIAACTADVTGTDDEHFAIEEIKGLTRLLGDHGSYQAGATAEIDVDVRRLADPTHDDLGNAIQGKTFTTADGDMWRPDVVHVIGHGEPGVILLRRDEEQIRDDQFVREGARLAGQSLPAVETDQKVTAPDLAKLFEPHHPRFVFLQTCYSSAIDGPELYATAERIVGAGVPAVLAMQYDIDRGAADKFAVRVYEQLLAGGTIGTAVSNGRQVLRLRDSGADMPYRAFGTPVVYLGTDGALLAAPPPRPRNAKQVPQATEAVSTECPRCGANCRYGNCATCGLYLKCAGCGERLENPFGAMCGACRTSLQQPPWQPPTTERTGMGDAPEKGPVALRNPTQGRIQQRDGN